MQDEVTNKMQAIIEPMIHKAMNDAHNDAIMLVLYAIDNMPIGVSMAELRDVIEKIIRDKSA